MFSSNNQFLFTNDSHHWFYNGMVQCRFLIQTVNMMTFKWWYLQASERLLFTRPRARTSRNIYFKRESSSQSSVIIKSWWRESLQSPSPSSQLWCWWWWKNDIPLKKHVCSNIWTRTAWNKYSDGTKKWFLKYLNKYWNKYLEETKKYLLKLYFNFISISTTHIHNLYQQS